MWLVIAQRHVTDLTKNQWWDQDSKYQHQDSNFQHQDQTVTFKINEQTEWRHLSHN